MFLCSIHPGKPFRCRSYPLGRIFEHDDKLDIASARSYWFHVELPDDCKGQSDAEEHVVSEWLGSQCMMEYIDTSIRCTAMLEKIAKANVLDDEDISALAFTVLYNFDSIVKKAMSDEDTLSFIENAVDSFINMACDLSTEFASA